MATLSTASMTDDDVFGQGVQREPLERTAAAAAAARIGLHDAKPGSGETRRERIEILRRTPETGQQDQRRTAPADAHAQPGIAGGDLADLVPHGQAFSMFQ